MQPQPKVIGGFGDHISWVDNSLYNMAIILRDTILLKERRMLEISKPFFHHLQVAFVDCDRHSSLTFFLGKLFFTSQLTHELSKHLEERRTPSRNTNLIYNIFKLHSLRIISDNRLIYTSIMSDKHSTVFPNSP